MAVPDNGWLWVNVPNFG